MEYIHHVLNDLDLFYVSECCAPIMSIYHIVMDSCELSCGN